MADEISVPLPGAPWVEVATFAHSYNAYDREGEFDDVADPANALSMSWAETGVFPDSLSVLRSALFFEFRRWHHFGKEPYGAGREYIDALLQKIGEVSGGSVPAPPDRFP